MAKVHLGIGGNLGRRDLFLSHTIQWVNLLVGQVLKESSIYETAAWGMENAPDFLNQVIEVDTDHSPMEVLKQCNSIERLMGRKRFPGKGYASRTADIDILHYEGCEMNSEQLVLPHPGIAMRKFVLIPFNEIAGGLTLPGRTASIHALLERSEDTTEVRKWDSLTAI
ncbi:MAG: 2-amino-4-hydroxy-6-hydroxymethyldihydropteridine diphosphokinase [Flavobacteriales bacterium]|jgi:2-amino-4-hydroxy-6-hydroxymethyldihydropteridine diphosphokinase